MHRTEFLRDGARIAAFAPVVIVLLCRGDFGGQESQNNERVKELIHLIQIEDGPMGWGRGASADQEIPLEDSVRQAYHAPQRHKKLRVKEEH